MNLHAKHITARISRHAHPMSVCMTARTLAHTAGPDSTPQQFSDWPTLRQSSSLADLNTGKQKGRNGQRRRG